MTPSRTYIGLALLVLRTTFALPASGLSVSVQVSEKSFTYNVDVTDSINDNDEKKIQFAHNEDFNGQVIEGATPDEEDLKADEEVKSFSGLYEPEGLPEDTSERKEEEGGEDDDESWCSDTNDLEGRTSWQNILVQPKFFVRAIKSKITGITLGKTYCNAWNLAPKQLAAFPAKVGSSFILRLLKIETDRVELQKGFQRDHALEIQRFEHIFKIPEPQGQGFQPGSWKTMANAMALTTDPKTNNAKQMCADTLNHPNNIIAIPGDLNRKKGNTVKWSNKDSAGPNFSGKWARSQCFVLMKYFKSVEPRYTSTSKALGRNIFNITNDKKLQDWVVEKLNELYQKDKKNLKLQFEKPVKEEGESFFKEDMGKDLPGSPYQVFGGSVRKMTKRPTF